jgi:hypothetical protein
MSKSNLLYGKIEFDSALGARTAEAMALPLMVCRHRNCRRGQRCRWVFNANGEPTCLRNLTAAQRAIFDEIYQKAHYAKGFLGTDSHQFDTPSGPKRVMDETAIAIARNVWTRWNAKVWDAARRAREKRLPPCE